MNRQIIILTLLIIAKIGFGQLISDVSVFQKNIIQKPLPVDSDFGFHLSDLDSLFENRISLRNGEYIIYNDTIETSPIFRLFITDGNINGVFCFYKNGFLNEIGSYKDDSLWTFRTNRTEADTTFMIGRWSHYGRFKTYEAYEWRHILDNYYKMPFDSNGIYIEKWFHNGGNLWQYREYKKGLGLIKEKRKDYKGTLVSIFEKFDNTSILKKFDNDGNLESILIDDKMEYWIKLRDGEESSHYKLDNPENKREELTNPEGENFQSRLFYPNGNLMEFYDRKAGIKIIYDENGEVIKVEKRKGVKIEKMNKFGG